MKPFQKGSTNRDEVDDRGRRRRASIEVLACEMPDRHQKDRGKRVIKSILNKLRLRKCASVDISQPDPSFKVAYLGNVVTGWAKGDGCVEKPLATLWRNYTQSSRPDVCMQLTVSGGGLKATTRDHGLTEYWANRLTCCAAPSHFPRIFCWIYRHEGRRLRHELRCHAVLCPSSTIAGQIEQALKDSVALALAEFKRDKMNKQNARLSLANSIYDNPTMPRRKILLSTGSNNYRPPLERSKSAPKLMSIEENLEEEDEVFETRSKEPPNGKVLRHFDSSNSLLEERRRFLSVPEKPHVTQVSVPVWEDSACDNQKRDAFVRVRFNDDISSEFSGKELTIDEKSTLVLEALVRESMNEEIEPCPERAWFRMRDGTEMPDSDEGSLSSGCDTASTVTSDLEQTPFTTIVEVSEEMSSCSSDSTEKKTECDFKVGGCVLNRVRSLERLTSVEIRKYCGLNGALSTSNILNEEVSLIPVGETQADFSSLKVYKKRSNSDSGLLNIYTVESPLQSEHEDEDNARDEGYDEVLDCTSSISNIVLV